MPEGVGESIKVDKSLLSAYSAGMRRIRSAFTGTSTYQRLGDDDIYYIFLTTLPMQGEVTTEIPSGGSEDDSSPFDGYMPYGKPFGFVRSAGLEPKKLAWVVAHELGHGAFQLQHVWLPDSRNMGGTWYKESTPNLMSYTQTPELFRWQWQDIHNPKMHSNLLADEKDLGAKKENFFFTINGNILKNRNDYYTLYTNNNIEVKIASVDTSYHFKKVKWLIEGKEISSKGNTPDKISIKISKSVLVKAKNVVTVVDSLNKKILDFTIRPYDPPYIVFENATNDGRYLFDNGFVRHESLQKDNLYDTLHVGRNNTVYYASVLGLTQNQRARLVIDKKEFSDAKMDDSLKVVIKASIGDKITINQMDTLILNAQAFRNLNSIDIEAKNIIADKFYIYAYIPSINRKIGLIEYYSKKVTTKKVGLVYVKFKNESSYPVFDHNKLQTYLNTYSMNQLFVNVIVDTVHLDMDVDISSMNGLDKGVVLRRINTLYVMRKLKEEIDPDKDSYFITNIDRGDVGGFHYPGANGGLQTLWKGSADGETREEVTAHELGHWLGLPHTFRVLTINNNEVQTINSPFFPVTENERGTKSNFMDYGVRRKSWFKFQMLNVK